MEFYFTHLDGTCVFSDCFVAYNFLNTSDTQNVVVFPQSYGILDDAGGFALRRGQRHTRYMRTFF